ncbi:DeoR/GlpR family DNA-binding transcription regulator [Microbacterium sp. Leaf436]|uniref:DeoR/GlpR family DNA-binding transcription regulator n=1 Tax=Microbacterium sp. Leaf436 TaxID=1736377 RepID=UPI000701D229|nr:DeoR/GlpR family DNA-binding transcription regulator [Microbacterium sp. Leaf436]KQT71935.1 hypothetical protein ASG45_13160 [Microbacterium sp. Leaf436]
MEYRPTENDAPIGSRRQERMRIILELLVGRDDMEISDLAHRLQISATSLRRDLSLLTSQGLVARTHGRVRVVTQTMEIPVRLRSSQATVAKRRIARYATGLLELGPQAVAVSGGTTTSEVVRALRNRRDTTVLTNALSIAVEAVTAPRLKVIVTGGSLRANSLEAVGPLTEAAFRAFNVGTAFLGADGVTAQSGVTTHDETEARANRAMVEHAQRVIVVCDGSKIGRITMTTMAGLELIQDVVTDDTAPSDELALIRESGVQVHVVSSS